MLLSILIGMGQHPHLGHATSTSSGVAIGPPVSGVNQIWRPGVPAISLDIF
jgi:hypothetical protein